MVKIKVNKKQKSDPGITDKSFLAIRILAKIFNDVGFTGFSVIVFTAMIFTFTSTKAFINECLNKENSPYLSIKNELDLIDSKQKSGTWMHRILALKFAAWLNPKFELWIFMVIEELLFGFATSQAKSIQRSVELSNRLHELKEKDDKTGRDFEEYIQCQEDLMNERYNRSGITKEKFKEAWDLFNQPKLEE